ECWLASRPRIPDSRGVIGETFVPSIAHDQLLGYGRDQADDAPCRVAGRTALLAPDHADVLGSTSHRPRELEDPQRVEPSAVDEQDRSVAVSECIDQLEAGDAEVDALRLTAVQSRVEP